MKKETQDLLQKAVENEIIDVASVRMQVDEMERKQILSEHPYQMWEGANGLWYTYLKEGEKRKLKKRKTRKELEDSVVAFYRRQEVNPTVEELFKEWIGNRGKREEIEKSTVSRYERVFESCFGSIASKRIKRLNEADIENFVKDTVHEKKLSRKAYSNLRTLIFGVWRLAKKKGLIDFNIKLAIDDITFTKKEFKKVSKSDEEQVFMEDEEEKVIRYLTENKDLMNLGLLLLFKTGLRIGELVALEKADFIEDFLRISKTETIYEEDGKVHYEVKDTPKTEAGNRDVIIPERYLWVMKDIKKACPFGKFLFEENGERIKSYQFRNRLYTVCKKVGVEPRGLHTIRKTYGSILYDADGVTEAFICQQMGHTDITCLKKNYYHNRKRTKEKAEMLNNVKVL